MPWYRQSQATTACIVDSISIPILQSGRPILRRLIIQGHTSRECERVGSPTAQSLSPPTFSSIYANPSLSSYLLQTKLLGKVYLWLIKSFIHSAHPSYRKAAPIDAVFVIQASFSPLSHKAMKVAHCSPLSVFKLVFFQHRFAPSWKQVTSDRWQVKVTSEALWQLPGNIRRDSVVT